MEMDMWLSALGDYGFPAAVTFYLLYRMERKLDQINRSVLLLYQKQTPPAMERALTALPPRTKKH
ncbi:YvrJ family protein [Alteribacter aurantiacus]|uniref:YvrJ family protein n=1 Tax=Alteribacter aurantiacus TaxID=254410 RepID=UPI00041EE728|nr:YvrJ family protein [Alteribacter aurantiacus]